MRENPTLAFMWLSCLQSLLRNIVESHIIIFLSVSHPEMCKFDICRLAVKLNDHSRILVQTLYLDREYNAY